VLPRPGRPPIRPRLIAGLLYLQHAFDLSTKKLSRCGSRTRTGKSLPARPEVAPKIRTVG
jgi:hypothetical protein